MSAMNPAHRGSLAVLLLRVVTGVAFLFHGWSKIQNPFHWLDKAANPPPGFLQALAALAEFGGGVGLLLGVLTPLCAAGIFFTMAYAIATHVLRGDPFVSKGGGSYELALVYLTIATAFLLLGPGRYSVDHIVANRGGRGTEKNTRDALQARLR
jgi:putative oxidoreductase